MKVVFKNTTGVTHNELKNVVCNDDLRPAMQGAYIDIKNQKLVVTDAHVMICYPIEVIENDSNAEGVIVPINLFNTSRYMLELSRRDIKSINPEFVLSDNYAEAYWKDELIYRCKYIDAKYPPWKNVMPNPANKQPISEFGFNTSVFLKFLKGLPKDSTNDYKATLFHRHRAIHFEQVSKEFESPIIGILMPVAIPEN